MVRTQIQLTERQARAIKEQAARAGVSMAEFVRQAVDKALGQQTEPDRGELIRRAIAAIGCVRSGESDVSTRHHDYLDEVYGQ